MRSGALRVGRQRDKAEMLVALGRAKKIGLRDHLTGTHNPATRQEV